MVDPMLDEDQQGATMTPSQDRLLMMQTPAVLDEDLLWDAAICFAEDTLGVDVVDDRVLSWVEVERGAFEKALRAQLDDTSNPLILRCIRTPERIAIIAPSGHFRPEDWQGLKDALETSQEEDTDAQDWRVLALPAAEGSKEADPKEAPVETSDRVVVLPSRTPHSLRADRGQPIAATPEQQAFLALRAAQPEGQHPTISMQPIVFDRFNSEALNATLEAIQERHENLYTHFSRFEDRFYIVLNDANAAPLTRKTMLRHHASLEDLGNHQTAELSQTLHLGNAQWQAEIYEVRSKAVLVCVFSQTIADQTSVDLFRAEVIAFYDAYCAGQDPEASFAAPELDYADFAALTRDATAPAAFWDPLLPEPPLNTPVFTGPLVAPCIRFTQTVPADMVERLTAVAQRAGASAEAVTLLVFARCLQKTQTDFDPWIVLPVHDVRPSRAAGVLGQFTRFCPLWIGELVEYPDLVDLTLLLEELRAGAALGYNELSGLMPGRVPQRFSNFFEFGPHTRPRPDIDLPNDISLSVRQNPNGLIANWAVRQDHVEAKDPHRLADAFRAGLDDI